MNVNPADPLVEQVLGQIVARWAPFSPLRARSVFDRGLRLLRTMQWAWTLPKPNIPKPEGAASNCDPETAAFINSEGRMVGAKYVWLRLSAVDRASLALELAISEELNNVSVKTMTNIRMLVGLLVQGKEITEANLIAVGSIISETFYRDVFYENGDYALEPPTYLNMNRTRTERTYCGYAIKGSNVINDCRDGANTYNVSSLDNSKILRVSRTDSTEPVYLYPPAALGLPANVTDYVFHSFYFTEFGESRSLSLTFDREMSFHNARIKMRCRPNLPVAFTMTKEALKNYDFHDLEFAKCEPTGDSELFINGEFTRLPFKFSSPVHPQAFLAEQQELRFTAPKTINFGSYQLSVGSEDTVELDKDILKISFAAKKSQKIEVDGLKCKANLLSVSEQPEGKYISVSSRDSCLVAGPQSKVSIKNEFRIDAVSRRIISASEGFVPVSNQNVNATGIQFRPNGDLWSFEPALESEGFKYFDTVLKRYIRKEKYFPYLQRICFNPTLRRFEDGESSNPSCP